MQHRLRAGIADAVASTRAEARKAQVMAEFHDGPEDGDIVVPPGQSRGSRGGRRGGAHADPLGRRRPAARGAGRHAGARRPRLEGILLGLWRRPRGAPRARVRGGRRIRRDRPAQRHPLPVALRASHGADHRQGLDRLSAARQGGGHIEDRTRAADLRPPAAGAGTAHRRSRRQHLGASPAAGRGGGDRGEPFVHDRARRAHARRGDGHQPDDGRVPQRRAQPPRGARADGY